MEGLFGSDFELTITKPKSEVKKLVKKIVKFSFWIYNLISFKVSFFKSLIYNYSISNLALTFF